MRHGLRDRVKDSDNGSRQTKTRKKSQRGKGRPSPTLTPEQEAEAAAKKAARAEAKAKGGKVRQGQGGRGRQGSRQERVKRDAPPRLRKLYDAEVREKLMQEFSLTNPMEAPRLTKITINMGLGEAVTNPKMLDSAVDELGAITGQRPVVTRPRSRSRSSSCAPARRSARW